MSCTIPNNTNGCNNLKKCVQINKELDQEMARIKRLKKKYDLSQLEDTQQMYMINPNRDCYQSKHVRTDPMMYMLDMSPEARCENPFLAQAHNRLPEQFNHSMYRVNPNSGNDFTPEEEEYVMYPKSNIPVRKIDLEQKSKFRIYPHMFPKAPPTEDEGPSDRLDIGNSVGGVDYPIPMRFQMRFLQDRGKRPNSNGGVDYDLRLKHRTQPLPHPQLKNNINLNVSENVDYFRTRTPNRGIIEENFLKDNALNFHQSKNVLHSKPHTVGVPGADVKDLTCAQQVRNLQQSGDIAIQPVEWYKAKYIPESSFYTDCEGCPKEVRESDRQAQLVKPMSKQERDIFGSNVDRRRPPYQSYPSQDAMKTSFFGLGPAIPPPNPLLLSNVPSNLLLSGVNIRDPERSEIQNPSDNNLSITFSSNTNASTDSNVDSLRGRDTRPFDPTIESFIGEGPFDQTNVMTTGPTGQATPMSEYESRIRPAPTEVLSSDKKQEYSRRNISLETDLQDKITKVVEQQRQILMQIADVRYIAPQLKDRELKAKDKSDIQDIHYSINNFGNSMYLLNQLRQLQSFLQKQQNRLLQRLEDVMPKTEFLKYQTKLKNRIAFYQNEIKRYNAMPDDDKIQAFTKVHFEGDPFVMGHGFYDHPHVGGLGNNRLASMKIGKDVSVVLYDRANRNGKVIVFHGPRRIPNIPVLWADNVSGIEVMKKITIQVQMFDAPFFQGSNIRVGPGFYDYPSVGGIGQQKLKSIIIPKGLLVRLFSQSERKGETIDFLGPQRLSFLPSGWSNKVFGVEVLEKNRDF